MDSGDPVQTTVALGLNFGSAGWLAFALHAIGVEIYVSLATHDRKAVQFHAYLFPFPTPKPSCTKPGLGDKCTAP